MNLAVVINFAKISAINLSVGMKVTCNNERQCSEQKQKQKKKNCLTILSDLNYFATQLGPKEFFFFFSKELE